MLPKAFESSNENKDNLRMVRLLNTENGEMFLLKQFSSDIVCLDFALKRDVTLAVIDVSGNIYIFTVSYTHIYACCFRFCGQMILIHRLLLQWL